MLKIHAEKVTIEADNHVNILDIEGIVYIEMSGDKYGKIFLHHISTDLIVSHLQQLGYSVTKGIFL